MEEPSSRPMIEELVIRHAQTVYGYAYRLTGCPTDAEDLVQETFLAAAKHIDQLHDLSRALSWLLTITRNNYLRDRRGPKVLPTDNSEILENGAAVLKKRPENSEADPELIQLALESLTEDQRVILLMFYFEERSYKEIAEELQIPIGTVMSRLARAKAALRKRLETIENKKNVKQLV